MEKIEYGRQNSEGRHQRKEHKLLDDQKRAFYIAKEIPPAEVQIKSLASGNIAQ